MRARTLCPVFDCFVTAGSHSNDLRLPGLLTGALANDTVLYVAGGEYFSLAASLHHVYGWGGNDYLSVGVGR